MVSAAKGVTTREPRELLLPPSPEIHAGTTSEENPMIARSIFNALLTGIAVLALATAAVAAEGEATENPKGVQVKLDTKGLRFETNDKTFKAKIGARLHLDAAGHPGHLPLDPNSPTGIARPTDGIEVRRGRIYIGATMLEDWAFLFDIDFADDKVAVKDMLLSYDAGWGSLTAGSQKQPYSEALEMSSNDLPFVERGIDNELILPFVDRALGGRIDSNGEHWHVAFGVYGDGIDPNEALDEGWGFSGRGVWTPILTDEHILHLGFRTAYREPSGGTLGSVTVRTETTHFSNLFISDTNPILFTNRVVLYGPEAAFAWGPLSLFGEYNRAYFEVGGGPNYDFQSGHIGMAWSLTGESRAASYTMKSSEFKRLTPKNDFSLGKGNWGAFEVATRYAYIDVSDADIFGGEEGRVSTSLNWYLNPIVRMMLDWTHVTNTKKGSITTNTATGTDVLTYRLQFMF
jgi:phosphate-selective porin OprO/OprP